MTQKKWDKMNDKQRWQWVIDNQDKHYVVRLDNDATFLEDEDSDDLCFMFDDYLGWSQGVIDLLGVLKIKAECV